MEDTLERLAGTMPDAQVADRLGLEVEAVKAWRREHDVAPFLQEPPQPRREPDLAPAPTVEPVRRRDVVRRRTSEGEVEAVSFRAAPPPEPQLTVAPPKDRHARGAAAALLDGVRDRLGTVSDDVIADELGVSLGAVGSYRRKHRIKAYQGYLFKKGHVPLVGAARRKKDAGDAASDAEPRSKTSPIDLFADLVGVESDASVAERARVSRAAVTAWRRKHGIVATARPGRNRRDAAAEAPAALDAFADRMGKIADGEVAKLAGVSRDVVGAYRRKHDIPAYDGFRSNRTAASRPKAPAAAPAPVTPPARPVKVTTPGKLRAYAVVASANGVQKEFIAVGEHMTDACGRAQRGLDARTDGPWLVDSVRVIGEALG